MVPKILQVLSKINIESLKLINVFTTYESNRDFILEVTDVITLCAATCSLILTASLKVTIVISVSVYAPKLALLLLTVVYLHQLPIKYI